MKKICKIYNLYRNINFNFLKSKIYIFINKNCKNYLFIFKIPFSFFLKKEKNLVSFIFTKKKLYYILSNYIINFYNKFFILYHIFLKLKGLGYRIIQISRYLIKIFLNRSNYIYIYIPRKILFKYKMRSIFFLSLNYNILRILIINLLLLKKFSVYRINGILYPNKIILIKPGKNKFR